MCPLCLTAVSTTEQQLLSHLLAEHPVESALLTLAISLGHIVLARRPFRLVLLDLGVLGLGLYLARHPNAMR